MKLGDKQRLFAKLAAKLILKAYSLGFEVTFGHAYRTDPRYKPRCHAKKLAIDLNLFKDKKYLRSTEAHRELGEWWEAQHELCRWGGRFGDGNHYSFAHAGMA